MGGNGLTEKHPYPLNADGRKVATGRKSARIVSKDFKKARTDVKVKFNGVPIYMFNKFIH